MTLYGNKSLPIKSLTSTWPIITTDAVTSVDVAIDTNAVLSNVHLDSVGAGANLVFDGIGPLLQIKTLANSDGTILLTDNGSSIDLSVNASAITLSLANNAVGENLVAVGQGSDLQIKALQSGSGITLSTVGENIVISSLGGTPIVADNVTTATFTSGPNTVIQAYPDWYDFWGPSGDLTGVLPNTVYYVANLGAEAGYESSSNYAPWTGRSVYTWTPGTPSLGDFLTTTFNDAASFNNTIESTDICAIVCFTIPAAMFSSITSSHFIAMYVYNTSASGTTIQTWTSFNMTTGGTNLLKTLLGDGVATVSLTSKIYLAPTVQYGFYHNLPGSISLSKYSTSLDPMYGPDVVIIGFAIRGQAFTYLV